MRYFFKLLLSGGMILIFLSLVTALASANVVPTSGLGNYSIGITPNNIKPPECSAIAITKIVAGSGFILGGSGNNLLIGSEGPDNLQGRSSSDCLVGGGGNDVLDARNGDDVLIGGEGDDILYGGAGNDILIGGPGFDICFGGSGVNFYDSSCEVQY